MATRTILVADDEPGIVAIARDYLDRAGFRVITAGDGTAALRLARAERPSLLVLDLMLPGMDGLDVARALREDPATHQLPIIMLTAPVEEADRLIGLELGADDYITKPFSPRELVARVRAVLRRAEGERDASTVLRAGDLTIDLQRRSVRRSGDLIELTATEFDLLAILLGNPNVVLTRELLLDRVWGLEFPGGTRTVDVHVASLRRKLGRPDLVRTVRGVGYKVART